MKKTNILHIMLDLIFLIVFNTIYYISGVSDYGQSAWISYGFIHFAYFMLILWSVFTCESENNAVLAFPIVSVSSAYFITELIIGSILIIINSDGFKAALIIQMIVAAIYLILLLSNMIANEHTADNIEARMDEINYVKESSGRLRVITNSVSDRTLKKRVERAYDIVHSSQVHSDISVRDIELDIMDLISDLQDAVSSNETEVSEIANKIAKLAEERNLRLKYMR